MKTSHTFSIDFISINSCVFPNRCVLIERACSLVLTESLCLEGFSINQPQCFIESAQRTPSWRSRWRSCLPGCQSAMIGGTPPWERWSANSWVIWGVSPHSQNSFKPLTPEFMETLCATYVVLTEFMRYLGGKLICLFWWLVFMCYFCGSLSCVSSYLSYHSKKYLLSSKFICVSQSLPCVERQ